MTSFLKIVGLVCLTACAREFRPSMRPPNDLRPEDYPAVLKTWTRADEGYSGFEHNITTKATMITPMLRVAFQKRFPEVYGYGGQVTRTELRDAVTKGDESITFFLAMYAPNFRWQDLEKADSIWHVTLQRSAKEGGKADFVIDASHIEKVKRDENLNTIFPYLNTFDTVYIVRFPVLTPASQPIVAPGEKTFLSVRIASSFAESVLAWSLEP